MIVLLLCLLLQEKKLLCLYWVITDYSFTVLLSLKLYLIVCVDCE